MERGKQLGARAFLAAMISGAVFGVTGASGHGSPVHTPPPSAPAALATAGEAVSLTSLVHLPGDGLARSVAATVPQPAIQDPGARGHDDGRAGNGPSGTGHDQGQGQGNGDQGQGNGQGQSQGQGNGGQSQGNGQDQGNGNDNGHGDGGSSGAGAGDKGDGAPVGASVQPTPQGDQGQGNGKDAGGAGQSAGSTSGSAGQGAGDPQGNGNGEGHHGHDWKGPRGPGGSGQAGGGTQGNDGNPQAGTGTTTPVTTPTTGTTAPPSTTTKTPVSTNPPPHAGSHGGSKGAGTLTGAVGQVRFSVTPVGKAASVRGATATRGATITGGSPIILPLFGVSSGSGATTSAASTSTHTNGHATAAAATATHHRVARSGGGGPDLLPTVVIPQPIRVVPEAVWLALAASLGLAGVGTGAAVFFGRRARRQAGRMAEAEAAALTDQLTGVLNRRGFTEAVERELARSTRYSRPFVLAYIDVRGLKGVNDSEGHLAGDQLLRGAASVLTASARAHDVIGRLGGDEFGILLAEQSADDADVITDRIREQVEVTRDALGFQAYWDLTVGTAAFPEDGLTTDELLAVADRRLYEQRGIEIGAVR